MASIDYKVLKEYGTIAKHGDVSLKLKLIAWNGHTAKYDLRAWKGSFACGGMTFSKDELRTLGKLIDNYSKNVTSDKVPVVEKTRSTIKVSSEPIIKKSSAKKVESETKKTETKKPEVEKPNNVIQFPKPKPEIERMITEGDATYEDCQKKIAKELMVYKDNDSKYVLEGILELCKVDADFRNNVMREDKDFAGAMEYMGKMCREGYGYKKGNMGWVDRDMGLGFTIDYFNLKPEPKPEIKTTSTTTVTTKSKRGRRPKREKVV